MRKDALISHEDLLKEVHYDPDTGVLKRRAGDRTRTRHDRYRRIRIRNVLYYEHRLAWFYMTKEWVDFIDHENLDKTDNRWSNLRKADKSKNGANRGASKRNTSGFKGVTFDKSRNKWSAAVGHFGTVHLGRHATKEEAHAAYAAGAKRIFAEFARAS